MTSHGKQTVKFLTQSVPRLDRGRDLAQPRFALCAPKPGIGWSAGVLAGFGSRKAVSDSFASHSLAKKFSRAPRSPSSFCLHPCSVSKTRVPRVHFGVPPKPFALRDSSSLREFQCCAFCAFSRPSTPGGVTRFTRSRIEAERVVGRVPSRGAVSPFRAACEICRLGRWGALTPSLLMHRKSQILDSAKPPVALGVFLQRGVELRLAEIRPERGRDDEFGVGNLPEQEVAHAHLAAGAD
jgi:hypothetical protein